MVTSTRKPTAERREEIAQAALQIIGEQGLTAFTTASLAEKVGVTPGALFRHFASREEILAAAAAHAIEKIDETFPNPSLPGRDRLFQLARNRVELLGSDSGLAWLLRSEQAYLALPTDSVTALGELVSRSRLFLVEALKDGAIAGDIRRDIEPDHLAVMVMGTIHALIGGSGIHRSSTRRADRERRNRMNAVLEALGKMLEPLEGGS